MPKDLLLEDRVSPKPRDLVQEMKDEGHWEGWVKPTLKDYASAPKAMVETIATLGSGMGWWPVSKIVGVGELLLGNTAEQARESEETAMGKAYHPTSKSAKSIVETVGAGFDLGLTPARMAGEGTTGLVGPKAGYLTELIGELATFKMAHGVKVKGVEAVKQRSTARAMLGKKLKDLNQNERMFVNKLAKAKVNPRNLAEEERKIKQTETEKAYETQKDVWLGERDVRMLEADVEARLLKKEIKSADKKTGKQVDEAIELYIDTKRNPSHLEEYYDKLKPEQKKVVDLSQNLPEYAQKIADKIEQSYKDIGAEGLDAAVIKNTIDNYASRKWDLGPDKPDSGARKFGTKTGHAKARKYETIIEGWADGRELKIKTATENLREYKKEIVKTIEDKRFVESLRKLKTLDGEPLLSTQKLEGYVDVEHPNMTVWEWAGQVEEGKTYGKNFFATEDGALFERRRLYAPKDQAKNLNNMLGISKLQSIPGVDAITKFNAVTKAWILQTSLFHQQAFMRSYYLPGADWGQFKTPRAAYREGIKSIEASDPVLMHGVRNGLTLGLKQDWSESLLREKTFIGKVLDKTKVTKEVKDAVNTFREAQAEFLFGELGAGLKAKSYMDTFKHEMKKYPGENPDIIAKRVASLINDDYGGLHLQRLGRNPTLQHVFRLAALAPDWTESNIRTMVKTLANKNKSQRELHLYRRFWGGVVLKGVGITALMNYAMSGGDVDKMKSDYEQAWKDGNFNWAKVNITPIYEAFGGEGRRKYFSVFGHFQDPAKFITDPVKSAKYKQSVVGGMGFEALSGTDWAGRGFTTIEDLISGEGTVKWGNKKGPIDYEQFPSYALSQIMGTQPIQVQAFMGYVAGETDGFDAISNSIGLRTTSTYEKKETSLKKISGLKSTKSKLKVSKTDGLGDFVAGVISGVTEKTPEEKPKQILMGKYKNPYDVTRDLKRNGGKLSEEDAEYILKTKFGYE